MKIIISNSSPVPIYEQIKSAFISAIMGDELKENESIPSIRGLALDIRISVMTIKKAYDELEREGYIVTVPGKGSFVAPKNRELAIEQAKRDIEYYMDKIINLAKMYNISYDEVNDLMKYLMEEMR